MTLKELYGMRDNIEEEKEFLASYNVDNYFRPSITSDVVAFSIGSYDAGNYRKEGDTILQLLMIKRGAYPFKDYWALPGGFLREEESVEECAWREIVEETGINPISMKNIGVFSSCDRDPRGRIISNAFTSIILDESKDVTSGYDASEADWFDISFQKKEGLYYLNLSKNCIELSAVLKLIRNEFGIHRFEIMESKGIGFDHAAIIGTALTSLQKDIEDFDVLFDFMPEKFTLLKLQKVLEVVTGKKLQPANFRRKIADYVEETEEYETGAGHRPAKLFIKKERIEL